MKTARRWMLWTMLTVAGLGLCAGAQENVPAKADEQESQERFETEKVVVRSYADMDELSVFRNSQDRRMAAVRFPAVFNELLRPMPRVLRSVRAGRATLEPLLAFETRGEIVCLMVRKNLDLLQRCANLIPGQQIIIEGVVLPEFAGFKCVIVDDVKFSVLEERGVQWEVLLRWPGEKEKLIAEPGVYTLTLPVPGMPDKSVTFQLEVRRVREIKTGVKPKEGAPQNP